MKTCKNCHHDEIEHVFTAGSSYCLHGKYVKTVGFVSCNCQGYEDRKDR